MQKPEQSEHERHDFRGKPMTLDEFGAELAKTVNMVKASRVWDELPAFTRIRVNAIESLYERMREGLERPSN